MHHILLIHEFCVYLRHFLSGVAFCQRVLLSKSALSVCGVDNAQFNNKLLND